MFDFKHGQLLTWSSSFKKADLFAIQNGLVIDADGLNIFTFIRDDRDDYLYLKKLIYAKVICQIGIIEIRTKFLVEF